MAHRGLKALSAESAVDLANRAGNGRALATLVLGLPDPGDGEAEEAHNVALGYLVYVRQGGFLVVFPCSDEVRSCLDVHGEQVGSAPAYRTGQLDIETPRGRLLGQEEVDMVDMSWAFINLFAGAAALRGFRDARVVQFKVHGEMGRPTKRSACELANDWISSMMPEEIAQEYLTGEEFLDEPAEEEVELQPDQVQAEPSTAAEEAAALRARVVELENMMKARSLGVPLHPAGATPKPAGKAPPLFPGPKEGQLSQAEWTRLQRLAGPPPRAGAAETRRPTPSAEQQRERTM